MFVLFPEPVEQLRSFADEFDIAIPLISDPGSRIIREFGILNTTLDEIDAPFYGIPYPGSYVVGADVTIVDKFFEQNSLVRTHPDKLLRSAQGLDVEPPRHDEPLPEPVAHVEARVALSTEPLRAMLVTDLIVDLHVPPGQHVYDGDVRIRVPLVYNGLRVPPNADGTHTADITGTIRWQSCDDHNCHIPRTEQFSVTVTLEPPNVQCQLRDRDRDHL